MLVTGVIVAYRSLPSEGQAKQVSPMATITYRPPSSARQKAERATLLIEASLDRVDSRVGPNGSKLTGVDPHADNDNSWDSRGAGPRPVERRVRPLVAQRMPSTRTFDAQVFQRLVGP